MDKINNQIEKLTEGFRSIEELINPPMHIRYHGNIEGFEFTKPYLIQFIAIHFGQMLSMWNATVILLGHGFQYEIMVLNRSILEAELKVRFVLSGLKPNKIDRKQNRFLERYFSDKQHFAENENSKRVTPQRQIREENTKSVQKDLNSLRDFGIDIPENLSEAGFDKAINELYRVGSNFTHGRYPEVMQYYEGDVPKFKCEGLEDVLSVATIKELIEHSLDRTINLLVTSIFKMNAGRFVQNYSSATKWALFESGIETEEIKLLRGVWQSQKVDISKAGK